MVDDTTPPGMPDQDPLPESNWLWRRISLVGGLLVLLLHRTWETYKGEHYAWTDYLIITVLILYTVAPSAEQISKMIATVALLGPGKLSLTKTQATATSPTGATTGTATATVAPATPAPTPATPKVEPEPGDDAGVLPGRLRVPRPPLDYTT